jgi:hypothetical protein
LVRCIFLNAFSVNLNYRRAAVMQVLLTLIVAPLKAGSGAG